MMMYVNDQFLDINLHKICQRCNCIESMPSLSAGHALKLVTKAAERMHTMDMRESQVSMQDSDNCCEERGLH